MIAQYEISSSFIRKNGLIGTEILHYFIKNINKKFLCTILYSEDKNR